MADTYTNRWGRQLWAPKVFKRGYVYSPAFNETVGRTLTGGSQWLSWFVDDMPYMPDNAPTLERLVSEKKVVPKNKEQNAEYVMRYNLCHQCSKEFPAQSACKRYCPECAAERKRESDRYSWMRRKEKKDAKRGKAAKPHSVMWGYQDDDWSTKDEKNQYIGMEIGDLVVLRCVKLRKASSLYLCKCRCGEEFITYQSTLTTKSIQACPCCMNAQVNFQYYIPTKAMTDTKVRAKELLARRKLGYLTVSELINESLLLCNCGCGRRIVVTKEDFMNRKVTSCGCIENDPDIHSFKESKLTGQKYGYATCIGATKKYQLEPGRSGRSMSALFLFRCDCGTEFYATRLIISRNTIKDGNDGEKECIFSCGCMKHKKIEN